MSPRVLLVVLLPMLVCAGSGAQPGPALVDPGMETDADGDGLPDGWRKYLHFPGSAKVSLDSEVKCSGAAAARVELGDNSRCSLSQYVAVAAPGAYTLSCHVRGAQPAASPVQIQINWFQSVDWPRQIKFVRADTPTTATPPEGEWTRLAAVGSRPENADLAQVALIFGNNKTPAGVFWVDDIALEPGARPWPLINNPGFEVSNGDGASAAGWGRGGEGEGFEMVRDTRTMHAGQAALRLTGLPGHGSRVCAVQMTPLFSAPQRLRLTFWYKGAGTADGIIDVLPPQGVKNREGGVYYDRITFTCPTPQDDWRQMVIEQETPAEAREAGLMRLQFLLYQKGDGDLWYDGLELELLD